MLEVHTNLKREGDGPGFVEPYLKRKREEDANAGAYRLEPENRSQGVRSPDRLSQPSATGSIKSIKREGDDQGGIKKETEPTTS
jgi:hypothetical protein